MKLSLWREPPFNYIVTILLVLQLAFISNYLFKVFTYEAVEGYLVRSELFSQKSGQYKAVYSYTNDVLVLYEYQLPFTYTDTTEIPEVISLLVNTKSPDQAVVISPRYFFLLISVALAIGVLVSGIFFALYMWYTNYGGQLSDPSGKDDLKYLGNFLFKQPAFYVIIGGTIVLMMVTSFEYVTKLLTYDTVTGVVSRHEMEEGVAAQPSSDSQNILYRPVYSYEYEGVVYEFRSPNAGSVSGKPRQEIGTSEKLLVNPAEPTEALFSSAQKVLIKVFLIFLVGILFLAVYYLHPRAILFFLINKFVQYILIAIKK